MPARDPRTIKDAFFDDYAVAWATRFGTAAGRERRIRVRLLEAAFDRLQTSSRDKMYRELTDAYRIYKPIIRIWHHAADAIEPADERLEVPWLRYLYAYALWIQGPRFARLELERNQGRTRRVGSDAPSPHRNEDVVHRDLRRVEQDILDLMASEVLKTQRIRLNQVPYNRFYNLGMTFEELEGQFLPALDYIAAVLGKTHSSK